MTLRGKARSQTRCSCGFRTGITALVAAFLAYSVLTSPAAASPHSPVITHHELSVTLDPATHRLRGRDRLTVSTSPDAPELIRFTLAPTLQVTHLRAESGPRSIPVSMSSAVQLSTELAGESTQVITVRLSEPVPEGLLLDMQYEGVIQDPPKEPRHLRFVTPSDTSGYIGPEGVYLSSESQWYPDLAGSLPTFHVAVSLPAGWLGVTHGRQVESVTLAEGPQAGSTATWEVPDRTEALTLVANQFVRTVREWKDASGRAVLLETDLLPENATLADEYLDASARYIEGYSRLLGPYPFTKFAVVENFFASGLGMPSFTLLGSGVIKRHYVQPYALGHEIVHSWIGNAVFNRPGTGNWVEGLTTYLANYYYDELSGHHEAAREQRRLMLAGYAVYVPPDLDYPVAQFMRKTDQKDNAIGYQKAAMVFHALRREVGDATFWSAVKRLGTEYRGRQVDWVTLEDLFARESGKSLRKFFGQWVERTGAPTLAVTARRLAPGPGGEAARSETRLAVRVDQFGTPFQVGLPLVVRARDGARYETTVPLAAATDAFTLSVPFEPAEVLVDPEFHLFRRIARAELPPMLNLLATDVQRTIIVTDSRDREEAGVYRRIVERMTGQDQTSSDGASTTVVETLDRADSAVAGSLLFLGPDRLTEWAQRADPQCSKRVALEDGKLLVDGTAYEGRGHALLVSCPRRQRDGHVATLFFGVTPEAAGRVARLLFFYGWQSYLVFRDGTVVARGDFGPEMGRIQVIRD